MKRIVTLVSVVLIVAFMLSACATKAAPVATEAPAAEAEVTAEVAADQEPVTLRFAYNWTTGDSKAEYYEGAIAKYQSEHPEVEIILEGTPGMEHQNKILVDLAGNNLPDLFMYWEGGGFLQPLVDADVALDMDQFFSVSQGTKRDDWNESAYDSSKYNGTLYMLPVESFKGFMIANKALFEEYGLEYPKTMAELEAVSKVFVENGIVPIQMASKGGNPGHLFFTEIAYQLGGAEESLQLDQTKQLPAAFVPAGDVITQMVNAQMFPADTIANGDWGPAVALYNEQKAAMVYMFPWKIGDLNADVIPQTEVIDFPKVDGASLDSSTFTVGGISMGLMINKASFEDNAKQAALVEFADFLVSDEMFSALGQASMMPAKKVTLDQSLLNPLFVAAVDFTGKQDVIEVVWNHFDAAGQTAFAEAMDLLFAGSPSNEVMNTLQAALNQ